MEDVLANASEANLVTVALDPGHGGSESGACCFGLEEKTLNLKIARYCQAALEKNPRFSVFMTRVGDEKVALDERVPSSIDAGANLIVSLHCNAAENPSAHGAEVWAPSDASWFYDETHVAGQNLAARILENLTALGLTARGVKTRECTSGARYPDGSLKDYYWIINRARESGTLGIIVEHAFVSNEADATLLADEAFLKQLGEADAAAIASFYA